MFSKKFISATKEYSTRLKKIPAPHIRKTFNLTNFSTAEIVICGLGFYEFYVNGKEITKGKFAPYISNPDQVLYYDKYDLKQHLVYGKNVFGFWLGNGFLNNEGGKAWNFDKAPYRSSPKLALKFIVDGKVLFEADESFKCEFSPIIYDDYRIGEEYDAKKEIEGWAKIDFDDSNWRNCILATTPKGEPKICTANPIKCVKTVKPVRVWRVECGNIYDFGANYTGVVQMNLKKAYSNNQKIYLHHGEALVDNVMLYKKNLLPPFTFDNDIWQTDTYIVKNDGKPETYEPHFTYHGFRYVYVENIDFSQVDDLLTLKVYHSDFEDQSEFSCDNQIINKIQEMTLASDKGNFQYFPTDCPHREKNGWFGDVSLSAEQLYLNFGCRKDLREWAYSITKAQRDDGKLPAIVPSTDWGYDWGSPNQYNVLVNIAYFDYKTYGDKQVILDLAPTIKKVMKHVFDCQRQPNGLFGCGLGEWGEPRWDGCRPSTPAEVLDTCLVIAMLKRIKYLLTVIDDKDGAEWCAQHIENLTKLFRDKWVDSNMKVTCNKQAGQARAVFANIFSLEEKEKAVKRLVEIIHLDGDRLQACTSASSVLFDVLAENGYHELALNLITRDGFPSYKYWIEKGYTSLPEYFFETFPNSIFDKSGARLFSLFHHMWGFVSAFFYKYIAGLKVNPEMNNPLNVEISPLVFNNVTHVNCTYNKLGKTLKYTVDIVDGKPKIKVLENSGFTVTIKT